MQLLQGFQKFFKERHFNNPTFRFLIAVSGGVDSVVLCELCKQSAFEFAIAHCNFGLRGDESERDEAFVRSLKEKYGVEVFVKKFDTEQYAAEKKISIQVAARNLRYKWFEEIRKTNAFNFVLLAHHLNDSIETMLINFFRGTGLEGLTGISGYSSTHFLRPLLFARRDEIEAFARENKLGWVEDSSNASSKYTRNFYRNDIIPQIKKVYPQVEENLANNLERFQQINQLYQSMLSERRQKLVKYVGFEIHIPVTKLLAYGSIALIYELIKEYGFGEKQVQEVLKLCKADSGKYIANQHYQIIRHRKWLIIAPTVSRHLETLAIEEKDKSVLFAAGSLQFSQMSKEKCKMTTAAAIAQLDAKDIKFPLLLRRWKHGDYFYPLGMRKKKKLARFFIDQKLSKTEKENVWVLESTQRIIWVVGWRIDDRFKITNNTQEILQIELTKLPV
ncbi:MAG: tRNA lysidine(34) synthetase TilS [Chitinophagaceae bacterium]